MPIGFGNLDQPINQESEIEKRRAVMHYEKSQAKATMREHRDGSSASFVDE
jgi:hypothetical protein